MKKILALVLVLVLALSLVACGGGKDDEITIAVIGQQTGNVVFLPAQEGALAAGEELASLSSGSLPSVLKLSCRTRS